MARFVYGGFKAYKSYRVYPEGAYNSRSKTSSRAKASWWVWSRGMVELWRWLRSGFKVMPRRMCCETRTYTGPDAYDLYVSHEGI